MPKKSPTQKNQVSSASAAIKREIILNQPLVVELHKPVIWNFNKKQCMFIFRDNICDVYLANMQLISKFNKGFHFLLCFIDVYRKCPWFVPLKVIKDITIS